MTRPPYTYAVVEIVKVLDGDTYRLRLDLGFHMHAVIDVRLLGWDTPEMPTPEGKRAKAFAEAWLKSATNILVTTEKDKQTFARYVASVVMDGEDLGQKLSDNGLAVRMNR